MDEMARPLDILTFRLYTVVPQTETLAKPIQQFERQGGAGFRCGNISSNFQHSIEVSIMNITPLLAIAATLLISGCASVDMTSEAESAKAKEFNPPSEGNAGVYIYRNSFLGQALKKDIWIDGKCLGESAPKVFFHTEVEGGKTHKIDTESEFSPNALELIFESGKNYFFRQFIKIGVFVGGAGLEQIPEEQGKEDVAKLKMAKPGKCSE
ncbi:MAG: DUF2846 domain-containing protein [Azoarcus sp.]|jgi:hypothetical protein|nr:DUF2846 domain-containing protein [Azoarcus sp.]